MTRKIVKSATITQANDATGIGNRRGMARRAKRQSSKKLRRLIVTEADESAQPVEIKQPYTPECDCMLQVQPKSELLSTFLDWLQSENYVSAQYDSSSATALLHHVPLSFEKLLAKFFDIDLDKVEREKRELLNYCRLKNAELDRQRAKEAEDGNEKKSAADSG